MKELKKQKQRFERKKNAYNKRLFEDIKRGKFLLKPGGKRGA
jgi:hypothetical protein